jgi:ankyrin repeat protein
MSILPEHPDLDQLRRQAKELLRGARASDPASLQRLSAVSAPLTLAGAQLAVSRGYGQSSWSALVHEVQARNATLDENVVRFLSFSVNDQIGRAARMLAETPTLSEAGFPVAVVLGDAARVSAELRRDPGAATRADGRTGWTALHLACASRFHLDPARASGLAAVTRLLLDGGAAVESETAGGHCWRPLECAVTSANSSPRNEPIIRELLARGAQVRPETLVAGLYAADGMWCLELLAGAGERSPALFAEALGEAVAMGSPAAVKVLLAAGADPGEPGPDGRSARRRALSAGVADTVRLLGPADGDLVERLLEAILLGDSAQARGLVDDEPSLLDRLDARDLAALVTAAEHGNISAVELALDVGFPIEARGDDGATALHAAAYAGSAETVALLLARGADLTERDARWHGQPLDWALVGSGEAPDSAPTPDWVATVTLLLDAGASLDEITLDADDPKPPSTAVLDLLRSRGVPAATDARK